MSLALDDLSKRIRRGSNVCNELNDSNTAKQNCRNIPRRQDADNFLLTLLTKFPSCSYGLVYSVLHRNNWDLESAALVLKNISETICNHSSNSNGLQNNNRKRLLNENDSVPLLESLLNTSNEEQLYIIKNFAQQLVEPTEVNSKLFLLLKQTVHIQTNTIQTLKNENNILMKKLAEKNKFLDEVNRMNTQLRSALTDLLKKSSSNYRQEIGCHDKWGQMSASSHGF